MAGGQLLQNAATTGNGNEVNCFGHGGEYTLTVVGTGTISAGEVQWEQSPTSGYSGTWAPLGPAITPLSGQVLTQTVSGPLAYVRARISQDLTGGGTVTVKMQPPILGF